MRLITRDGVISQERLTRVRSKDDLNVELESGYVLRVLNEYWDGYDIMSLLLGRSIRYLLSASTEGVTYFIRIRRAEKPYSLMFQAALTLRKTYSTPAQRRYLKKIVPYHLREITFQCPR